MREKQDDANSCLGGPKDLLAVRVAYHVVFPDSWFVLIKPRRLLGVPEEQSRVLVKLDLVLREHVIVAPKIPLMLD